MGSCICLKGERDEGVIKTLIINTQKDVQINVIKSRKTSMDEDTSINNIKKVTKKVFSKKLSCDEYWDEIRKNTDAQIFFVKKDNNSILENQEQNLQPLIKTFKTTANYDIIINEVNNVLINPNEVYYVQNKDAVKRSPSPKPKTEKINSKPKSITEDIDKQITESIKNKADFDKLYDEILSKHVCKK